MKKKRRGGKGKENIRMTSKTEIVVDIDKSKSFGGVELSTIKYRAANTISKSS
jgi:hypothetical protein